MAENIVLSVQLNGADTALAQLTQLDSVVNRLKANRNIKISVNARSLATAANNAQTLNTNLTQAANSAKTMGTTGAHGVQKAGQAIQTASRNAESFNTGMGNVVLTMAKFRLASAAINLVATGFKEAFKEMKNVDSEMVNIRKVTGFSADEMERLSKNAYSLASKYGRSASGVLSAETVFARAGYTDQIEQLGELSLLLQNVGDLQADDAAKFVVATDKAYKLGGSYEKLMTVIDGLDNITNRNATDMQKMTEGMTVAGSVFAESGESIEMFAALLGTATANTQRSGSEMARGLRTILMNLRQIRGETEDGELINGESIAAASKALKDYANISTMENGQLRKASDVLADLAAKWDTLTETQQSAIAEAVAGKRQANVLMALMGDWESVQKMMKEYEDAAGTAARENAMYMESWAAKTEQVKASWTELVSTLVSSDSIKSVLDMAVDFFGMLTDLNKTELFQGIITSIKTVFDGTVQALDAGINGLDELFASADKKVAATKKRIGDLLNEQRDDLNEYLKSFGDGTRYAELASHVDQLTDREKIELSILESQRQQLERIIELRERELQIEEEKLKKQQQEAIDERDSTAKGYLLDIGSEFRSLNADFFDTGDLDDYRNGIYELIGDYADAYNSLVKLRDAGTDLTTQEQRFIDVYEQSAKTIAEGSNAVEVYGRIAAIAAYAYGHNWGEAADTANGEMDALAETLTTIPEFKNIDINVTGNAEEKLSTIQGQINSLGGGGIGQNAKGTSSAPGGLSLVNEKGPEMIAANGLAWIAGGGKPTVTMLPKGATVLTAQETRRALGPRSGIPAYGDGIGDIDAVAGQIFPQTDTSGKGYNYIDPSSFIIITTDKDMAAMTDEQFWAANKDLAKQYKKARQEGRQKTDEYLSTLRGAWSGGDTGPTPPDFKALENDLTKLLKNLDAQAELAENEEDFVKAMMVYGEAQDAIADLLEQYRANGYAEDSDEVLRLANMGYDYAGKQLGEYDELQKRLIDALNALTQATEDANALAERQEAVDKAREALRNAESQRTVRIFNPVTGQWEWVANAADVEKARENLKSAEDALQQEQISQTIDAIKNAKPEDLAGMTLTPAVLDKLFNGTPEQQSAFLNALNAATGGADYLGSDAAKTAWNQGNSIGTQYNLNGITLTEAQASGMSIKELLDMLRGLKVMT